MGSCHISVKFLSRSRNVTTLALKPMTQSTTAPRPGPPKPVSSPCIMVCTVDGASGLCLGCYRTLNEIATWSQMAEPERQAIMAALPARLSQIDPRLL